MFKFVEIEACSEASAALLVSVSALGRICSVSPLSSVVVVVELR